MYDYKEDLKTLVEEVKMKERERILVILKDYEISNPYAIGRILND